MSAPAAADSSPDPSPAAANADAVADREASPDHSANPDESGAAADASADAVPTDDPRLAGEFVRSVPGDDGDVHLVGVVHDHPASVHRVGEFVRTVEPDVLALELPSLAVPLYERYAEDGRSPPAFGGEMSAAVRAAEDARVVGVDAPDGQFLRHLAAHLAGERPPAGVTRRLLGGLLTVSREALACRLAASLARWTDVRVEVGTPVDHGVDADDPPAAQADDERRQVRRSRSLLGALSTPAADHRDEVREGSLAAHLADLRADGDVVAVLGMAHLDAVERRLADR